MIKDFLTSVLPIPFEISEVDNMHFSINKSDFTKEFNEASVVNAVISKFPWAMAYDWTKTQVKFTLA